VVQDAMGTAAASTGFRRNKSWFVMRRPSQPATEIIMVKDDRKNKLLANAVANLKRDKLGMGIDLLDEIMLIDPNSKVALLARGSVYLKWVMQIMPKVISVDFSISMPIIRRPTI
jgi:hypothetical protein